MENNPVLISCKPLPDYEGLERIPISTGNFSLGRSLSNTAVIPFLSISRNHCMITKTPDDAWVLEDRSAFGVKVNGRPVKRGKGTMLSHNDIITLEPSREFSYRFHHPPDDCDIPRKRIKLEQDNEVANIKTEPDSDLINNVKLKFEQSQNCEKQHIETKIQSAKQMQTTSKILKDQLQVEMDKKMQQLTTDYASQIENLKGEKTEVERQKALLLEERDAQLSSVRQEMEQKIQELQEQIKKNSETEAELLKQNQILNETLLKERETFLAELSRESSSKQDMMEQLEAKMREKEEIRIKERQELEIMLRKENEQLRLAKEKEIKELEEEKKQRELELQKELDNIKKNLAEHMEQTEQNRLKAEQQLSEQQEQLKKLSDEDQAKMEQLRQERQEIQQKLAEAENNAEKSVLELREKIEQREIELAALAAERIQFQADQSSEVINALQAQLENVKAQLQTVETEKNTLLECLDKDFGEGTSSASRDDQMQQVGQILENEMQCSICAELFIEATTLGCSHSFCKYCITMWKKKKRDCPICRTPIQSECRSLAIDGFIERMSGLSEEKKKKRQEILMSRQELVGQINQPRHAARSSRRGSESSISVDVDDEDGGSQAYSESDEGQGSADDDDDDEEGLYASDDEFFGGYNAGRWGGDSDDDDDDEDDDGESGGHSDSGSDEGGGGTTDSDAEASGSDADAPAAGDSGHRTDQSERRSGSGRRRRRRGGALPQSGRDVPGLPGFYYGGYGSCFTCGATGHWAPGCPFR